MKNKQGKQNGGTLPCLIYQKKRFYRQYKSGKLKRLSVNKVEGKKVVTKKGIKIVFRDKKDRVKLAPVYSERILEKSFESKILMAKTGKKLLRYYYREYFEIKKKMSFYEAKFLAYKYVKVPKNSITMLYMEMLIGKKRIPFATNAHMKKKTLLQEMDLFFEHIINNIYYYGSSLEKAKVVKLSFISFYKGKKKKYKKPKIGKKVKYKKPKIEEIEKKFKYKKPAIKIKRKKYKKPRVKK